MVVELKGTHHFNNCEEMKRIMPNIHDGVLSSEYRKTLIME
jgi:hypothetical protein